MHALRTLLALAAVALLLAACEITISPVPAPTPDVSFTAPAGTTTNPSPQRTLLVPAGTTRVVEVRYPSNPSADLMYFEVNDAAGIRLELLDPAGARVSLYSRSAALFADNLGALRVAALEQDEASERASVGIGYTCLGPCLATPYRAGTQLVRLVNESSRDRNVRLLAYGFRFDDLGEPNDTPGTASRFTVTAVGQGPSGAIEHVNDRDFHEIRCAPSFPESNLRLTLATSFGGDMVLIANGVAYRPGTASAFVPCASVVEVTTLDGSAGPSGASRYSIVVD